MHADYSRDRCARGARRRNRCASDRLAIGNRRYARHAGEMGEKNETDALVNEWRSARTQNGALVSAVVVPWHGIEDECKKPLSR